MVKDHVQLDTRTDEEQFSDRSTGLQPFIASARMWTWAYTHIYTIIIAQGGVTSFAHAY